MYGTIKRIIRDKSFGFITPDDGSEDVYFNRSRLDSRVQFEDLREGDEVQFQVRSGDKGPQALGVKLR
jgi:CspA family cold shock protein